MPDTYQATHYNSYGESLFVGNNNIYNGSEEIYFSIGNTFVVTGGNYCCRFVF